jgi:hypothetical protein
MSADGEHALGKLVPRYGGKTHCALDTCSKELSEDDGGAYLYTDLETGKLVVFCADTAAFVELNHRERFRLVAL